MALGLPHSHIFWEHPFLMVGSIFLFIIPIVDIKGDMMAILIISILGTL